MLSAVNVPQPAGDNAAATHTTLWTAGLVLAVWWACFQFSAVWVATGIGGENQPFMDLYGILAACDAARAGVDPFLPNDFDPYHRPHVYTTWWLELGRLGLTRADTRWLGATLLVVTLLTAALLVRPRLRSEGAVLALLLVSPAFLLAVNRANNDLVVFVLVSAGLICFRSGAPVAGAIGVVLFAVSAVLKYYPLVTLVALLGIRSRRGFMAALGLYGVVLVLAWPGLEPGLRSAARFMPHPDWLYAYGAPVLLRNLGLTGIWGWLAPAGVMALWAGAGTWRQWAEATPDTPPAEQNAEREFVLGAAMVLGLFFWGSSYVYKLVFAVWLLPWLWLKRGDPADGPWARRILALLLAAAWFEGVIAVILNLLAGPNSLPLAGALLKGALTVSQLLTWAWVACLLRVVLGLLGRQVRSWWWHGRPAAA